MGSRAGESMHLTKYLNKGTFQLLRDALKASWGDRRQTAFWLGFLWSQQSARFKRLQAEKRGEHVPPFLIASITSHCNLFCRGCYARANKACGEKPLQEQLSAQEWENIFREAKSMGVTFILLAGGEPLLRPDVLEAAAGVPNVLFPVFTNGTLLSGGNLELFSQNGNILPILSIEGDREKTDARRGEGTFALLEAAMDSLRQRNVFFGASVTVTNENLEAVTRDDFVKELHAKGCKLIIYVEYVPADGISAHLALSDGERELLAKNIAYLRRVWAPLLLLSFPGDERETGGCLAAGRGFVHINAHGGAEPCPFSPFSDTNVRDTGLRGALRSPLFQKLQDSGVLLAEHTGGCVLFAQEEQVKELAGE